MVRKSFLFFFFLFFLSSCSWRSLDTEGWTSPSPSGAAVTPTPAPPPWKTDSKQVYNELFSLPFNPDGDRRINAPVNSLMYEGLFSLNERFEPEPALAYGLVKTGEREYLVKLRSGIKFHDGSTLTPEDAVRSINAAEELKNLARADVSGEGIVVTFTRETPKPEALLTVPVSKEGEFLPAGTGVYKLVRSEDGAWALEVNDDYRAAVKRPLKRIELREIRSCDELPYAIGSGDVSLFTSDPSDSFGVYLSGNLERWDYPTLNMVYLQADPANDFLAAEGVTEALALAFDRTEIVDTVLGGAGDPAALPISPANPAYTPGAEYNRSDPRAFAAAANALGWFDSDSDGVLDRKEGKNAVNIALSILVDEEDAVCASIAELLCAQLRVCGIEAAVDRRPPGMRDDELDWLISKGGYDFLIRREKVLPDFSAPYPGTVPLLFSREYLYIQRGMAEGVNPVYGSPFRSIGDITING